MESGKVPLESEIVIEARNLKTHFSASGSLFAALLGREEPAVRALDGVDIIIPERSIVGLVGENGCGKSAFGMSLVRMHEPTSGDIRFRGASITRLSGPKLKQYRGKAQIIFQDPYSSLNPRLTVSQIIEEPLRIHGFGTKANRGERVTRAMDNVRLPAAEYRDHYPSDLSGGQRQRVAIARALVMEPEFIVADEHVSMLDVSVQAGVLELLDDLARNLGLAVLYISHDIATVGYICGRVSVMYLGRVVEESKTNNVLQRPMYPYTECLMAAIPNIDTTISRQPIEFIGDVPSSRDMKPGCRFASRCPYATSLCHAIETEMMLAGEDHFVRCHIYGTEEYLSAQELVRPSRERAISPQKSLEP